VKFNQYIHQISADQSIIVIQNIGIRKTGDVLRCWGCSLGGRNKIMSEERFHCIAPSAMWSVSIVIHCDFKKTKKSGVFPMVTTFLTKSDSTCHTTWNV
jgi:hypothetical protein